MSNKIPLSIPNGAFIKRLRDWLIVHPEWLILLATFLIFQGLFSAKFWLIDDHQIVWLLERLHADGLAGFWAQWATLGDFESSPRFRPVYYLFRAIEILLWQDNVFLWVVLRLMIASIFSISVYRVFQNVIPKTGAFLLSLTMLCVPWLSETLFRLGPAEGYAMLFTSLLLLLVIRQNKVGSWLGITFCVALLIGTKENFFILMPLQIWAVVALARDGKTSLATVAFGVLVFSLGSAAILVYKLMLTHGADLYGNTTGVGRLQGLRELFLSKKGWLSLSVVLGCLCTVLSTRNFLPRNTALIVFLGCVMILGFNLYVYMGIPDIHSHYAFPYWTILLGMAGYCVAVIMSFESVQRILSSKPFIRNALLLTVGAGLVIMMTVNVSKAHRYAAATRRTDAAIKQIVQEVRRDDEIIVNVAGGLDAEPVSSIARFLDYEHVSNSRFVSVKKIYVAAKQGTDSFSEMLVQALKLVELQGDEDEGYKPSRESNNDPQRCLEIYFREYVQPICARRVLVLY